MKVFVLASSLVLQLIMPLHAERAAYAYSHPSICQAKDAPYKKCLTAGDVIEFFETLNDCAEAAKTLNLANRCRRIWFEE